MPVNSEPLPDLWYLSFHFWKIWNFIMQFILTINIYTFQQFRQIILIIPMYKTMSIVPTMYIRNKSVPNFSDYHSLTYFFTVGTNWHSTHFFRKGIKRHSRGVWWTICTVSKHEMQFERSELVSWDLQSVVVVRR